MTANRKLINKIVSNRLTKGVQPNDLMEGLFYNDFDRITTYRKDDLIITELFFKEDYCGFEVNVILRYTYDKDMYLQRIEEVIGNQVIVEWDRETVENDLRQQIIV